MSDFEASTTIAAPQKEVFAYVTDPANMPDYLPTVSEAHKEGPDRIGMSGESEGQPYEGDGFFHIIEEKGKMTWGSDGHHKVSRLTRSFGR